jgi:hypothetical protein
MCTCQSYNLPEPEQTTPEVVLVVPRKFPQDRPTICVDPCIAPAVQALWDADIWTLSSCCGHNDSNERLIVVDRADRTRAEAVLRQIGDSAHVYAWELIGPNGLAYRAEQEPTP